MQTKLRTYDIVPNNNISFPIGTILTVEKFYDLLNLNSVFSKHKLEVVGKRRSRLIMKGWAEKEDALTGFYHKMLEEIVKRIDIRIFVDESITQYNISSTTIQDSVIQRSKIGAQKRLCPQCGREARDDEKFCMECGAKLE